MATFIIRRILWMIPILLVVIFLTFMMMRQNRRQPIPNN